MVEEARAAAYLNQEKKTGPTMSSRQFAQILKETGKRHDNIKRTMKAMENHGFIQLTQNEEVNHKGQKRTVYHVNERDSYVVMAQLSPEFTAHLVDAWRKLKELVAEKRRQEQEELCLFNQLHSIANQSTSRITFYPPGTATPLP